MVVHVFPAAKLGALLMRQISKPIADIIKNQAKSHPVFRRYFCMPPAYVYNWCEVKIKMTMLNSGRTVKIPPLSDATATELGANILGEAIIFIIAASLLLNEVARQSRKEESKEFMRRNELEKLCNRIYGLRKELELQDKQINVLKKTITDLERKAFKKPWSSLLGPQKKDPHPKSPTPSNPSGPCNLTPHNLSEAVPSNYSKGVSLSTVFEPLPQLPFSSSDPLYTSLPTSYLC